MNFLIFSFVLVFAADCLAADCGTVPVTQWGEKALQRKELLQSPVNVVVIQHTASPECKSDGECERTMKAIRDYHINTLRFDDIGTSFLVGGNGKVYEGAGWKYVGAHTRGYNKISIGISFIGNYSDKLPTTEALNAVKELLKCGVEQKLLGENYHLFGHRQLSSTVSPGETLQKEIEGWNNWSENPKDALN